MKWFTRLLLWMILLAPPCWLVSASYQLVLARMVEPLLELTGKRVSVFQLQVYAPLDLGVFIAMCLASATTTRSRRYRALVVGLPLLAIVEVVVIVLAAIPAILIPGEGLVGRSAPRMMGYAIQTIVWVSAPIAWLVLLGSCELPSITSNTSGVGQRSAFRLWHKGV